MAKEGKALLYASKELKRNEEIVKTAINQDGERVRIEEAAGQGFSLCRVSKLDGAGCAGC